MLKVVAAVVIRKRKVLLLHKRWEALCAPGSWYFVGGKQKPGESERECLSRETFEETGSWIRTADKIGDFTGNGLARDGQIQLACYLVQPFLQIVVLSPENDYAAWVGRHELQHFAVSQASQRCIEKLISEDLL